MNATRRPTTVLYFPPRLRVSELNRSEKRQSVPNTLRTWHRTLLVAAVILTVCVAMAGCSAPTEVLAEDYPCTNALDPAVSFRFIVSPLADEHRDTLPLMANHYLEPHRWRDTVHTLDDRGRPMRMSWALGAPNRYCITAIDSLYAHAPNARGWITEEQR